MAHKEHVELTIGADATAAERVMVGMVGTVKNTTHSIKEYFSDITRGFLGAQGIERGVDFVKDKFREILSDVKRIKNESEAIGVSTNFLQNIENAGKVFNITGAEMDSMLNKFVKTLPVGSDVEEEFNKITDRIAALPDPADKARLAIEAFGRAGVKMLPALSQGSAKLKELGESFSKYSEREIEQLEKANLALEKFENKSKTVTAKIITGFPLLFQGLGNIASEKGIFGAIKEFAKAATGGSMAEINKAIKDSIELERQAEGGLTEAEKETAKIKYKQLTQNQELLTQYADLLQKAEDLKESNKWDAATLEERASILEEKIKPLEKEISDEKKKELDIKDKIAERTEDGLTSTKLENELIIARNKILANQIDLEAILGKQKQNNADIDKSNLDKQKKQDAFKDTFRRTEDEAAKAGDAAANKAKGFHAAGEAKRLAGDAKGAEAEFKKESNLKLGDYVSPENQNEYNRDMMIANDTTGRTSAGLRKYHADHAKGLREGISSIKKSEQDNDPFVKALEASNRNIFQKEGVKVISVTYANGDKSK